MNPRVLHDAEIVGRALRPLDLEWCVETDDFVVNGSAYFRRSIKEPRASPEWEMIDCGNQGSRWIEVGLSVSRQEIEDFATTPGREQLKRSCSIGSLVVCEVHKTPGIEDGSPEKRKVVEAPFEDWEAHAEIHSVPFGEAKYSRHHNEAVATAKALAELTILAESKFPHPELVEIVKKAQDR